MSAHYWGLRLEETQRYRLGDLLSDITRHFLLMTATPHNGKEEDFQLFLALLTTTVSKDATARRSTRSTSPT